MKKEIALQNKKISYILRKSKRARRMRLAVYCDGSVIVTAPFDLKETSIERFIREKTDWLFGKIAFFRQFNGKEIARYSEADYLKYKDQAYELTVKKLKQFNKIYGYTWNSVNIKNQKTRWGSCSKKGNLNFNYKVALLPDRLADYVIVHELCHLGEFNHSKKFWKLVSKSLPDHSAVRDELKKSGISFH